MLKRFAAILVPLLLLGTMAVARAQTVTIAPPPPRAQAIPVAPATHWYWVNGHWNWNGLHYVWVSGRRCNARTRFWYRRTGAKEESDSSTPSTGR
jgi:hypothetical protein